MHATPNLLGALIHYRCFLRASLDDSALLQFNYPCTSLLETLTIIAVSLPDVFLCSLATLFLSGTLGVGSAQSIYGDYGISNGSVTSS